MRRQFLADMSAHLQKIYTIPIVSQDNNKMREITVTKRPNCTKSPLNLVKIGFKLTKMGHIGVPRISLKWPLINVEIQAKS